MLNHIILSVQYTELLTNHISNVVAIGSVSVKVIDIDQATQASITLVV